MPVGHFFHHFSWKESRGDMVVGRMALCLILLLLTACQTSRPMLPLNLLIPSAWEGYQRQFIDVAGRVIRPSNQDDTVSEGQAYAMLMAVALNDRPTFDLVWDWTTNHLSRVQQFGDRLLAWHWAMGQGVTDWNSAADAEVDVALALLLAHARWHDESYRVEALQLLQDILELETEVIAGERYLLPGNWRLDTEVQPLNPSYFSPAHFRLFYAVTGDERWNDLLRSTYIFLHRLPLQETIPVRSGLVPDWIGIDSEGNLKNVEGFSQHVTWDAVRMPWRVALDVLWGKEGCGVSYVRHIVDFWEQEWGQRGNRFFLEYRLEGEPLKSEEQAGAYAMALPALQSVQSPLASEVTQKMQRFFYEDGQYFQHAQDYYQNSLSLLGLLSLRTSDNLSIPSLVHELQQFSLDERATCTHRPYSLQE
jgi:endo-1,4-beta-D-glucanase Y